VLHNGLGDGGLLAANFSFPQSSDPLVRIDLTKYPICDAHIDHERLQPGDLQVQPTSLRDGLGREQRGSAGPSGGSLSFASLSFAWSLSELGAQQFQARPRLKIPALAPSICSRRSDATIRPTRLRNQGLFHLFHQYLDLQARPMTSFCGDRKFVRSSEEET